MLFDVFARVRCRLDILNDILLQRYHCKHLPSRAEDVIVDDLRGKTCVVTGPTSGIGVTTARALVKRGARVVLACRTPSKAEALVERWTKEAAAVGTAPPDCAVMALDLDSLASVEAFAKAFQQLSLIHI